jgi:signal peptidase I
VVDTEPQPPSDLPPTLDAPDASDASRRGRLQDRRAHNTKSIVEWIIVIVAAIAIAVLLRTYVVQTFYIPSDSMVPTLQENDRVVVNKLSYKAHPVHRGDIVVFTTPKGVDPSFKDLVKRVVGLPGETVEGHDDHVYINGRLLPEKYLKPEVKTSTFPAYVVPPNSYWVMGDNRGNSEDSRVFKAIAKKTIVGRVFVRIWPLNRIGLL